VKGGQPLPASICTSDLKTYISYVNIKLSFPNTAVIVYCVWVCNSPSRRDGRGFVWKTKTPSMLIMTPQKYVMSFHILSFFGLLMVEASLSAVSLSVTWDLASLPVYERPLYNSGGIPYTSLFNGATNLTNLSDETHFLSC